MSLYSVYIIGIFIIYREARTVLNVYIIQGVSYNENLSIGRFAFAVSEEYNIVIGAISPKMMKGWWQRWKRLEVWK